MKNLYFFILFIFTIISCKKNKEQVLNLDITKFDGIYDGTSMYCHTYFDTTSSSVKFDTTVTLINNYSFILADEKQKINDNFTNLSQVINNDSIRLSCASCAYRSPMYCTVYTKKDSVIFFRATYGIGSLPDNRVYYTFLKRK